MRLRLGHHQVVWVVTRGFHCSSMIFAVAASFQISLHFFPGHGFFTHDLALRLENGGYRVTGRLNNAIRIQGVWLDVANIEEQMVNIVLILISRGGYFEVL